MTFPKNIELNIGQFMKKYRANIGIKKEIIGGYIGPGGLLTLTWYTYMCLPFGVLFREIWYSDRGVFIRDEGAQI